MMKKSSSEPCCSKDCRKNTKSLNNKIDELKNDLYEANIYRHSYKLGIDQLEHRLAEYKEREVKYIKTIRSLERDKEYNLRKINKLTNEVETLQEEKDVIDGKLARLIKSSKDLEDIIKSQRFENVKERVGYNAVSPPAANLYHFSWTGLPEFDDDTVTDYSRPSPTVESTSAEGQNKISTTAENGKSTDSILSKPTIKFVKASDKPTERPTTNKAEFVKAAERPTTDKVETAKKPAKFSPVNRKLPTGNSNVSTVCCCCSRHVNTARPKAMINRRNMVKDVQASASWVWKSVKRNSASIILKRYNYVDVRGRSRSVMAWVPKKD
nr:hypothetical protein [Tanacetum cinerariifolium]